ncbi:hypothetical protein N6H05_06330 [Sphingobium sp. WTD-1]|jgi:hypothetical protein|uniref:DUF6968 family protein n=1 Tax=Sphingobium sp. WTD-1 TaxID=2979467 RepID=UPI0024DEC360|nr:hypothetical protein [Sphingobium sp. WTD-1]WIA57406.1 hypothetical protein N6H05_06330 [Sphingobium sp. WTD-1]
MKTDGESPVFVEREFSCAGQLMLVRFYQPVQMPTAEYKCEYEILWPDRTRRRHSFGVDSIQALTLAMGIVHVELTASDYYKDGQLTYFDSVDLGLPPLGEAR